MFKEFVPIEVLISLPTLNRDFSRTRWSTEIDNIRYVFETTPNYGVKDWWEWRLVHVFILPDYPDPY